MGNNLSPAKYFARSGHIIESSCIKSASKKYVGTGWSIEVNHYQTSYISTMDSDHRYVLMKPVTGLVTTRIDYDTEKECNDDLTCVEWLLKVRSPHQIE